MEKSLVPARAGAHRGAARILRILGGLIAGLPHGGLRLSPARNGRFGCLLASLAVAASALPAAAQERHAYHPTKFQDLAISMEMLLNNGFAIVNEAIAPDGVGNYLLHRENKWVTCSLRGGEVNGRVVVGSRCVALN
jgi:hypothetical protein